MRTWMVTAALLALLFAPAEAKDDDARIRWLRENAAQVRSIDPADVDFKDLEPLKQILGGARIVQLGEQTHGDGACFLAKARLIKFLHQEMGFDVLAFESGFYDCAKGWETLKADAEGTDDADFGIFGIWTQSHEVKPTLDYLRTAAQTKRPLELCGYDCQLTSGVSRKHLEKDLRTVTQRVEPALLEGADGKQVDAMLKALFADKPSFDQASARAAGAWLAKFRACLEGDEGTLEARARTYWAQLTLSLGAQIENIRARSTKKKFAPEDNNRRDKQMAENLIWLAETHFPRRKIIVWAATFHLMRNPAKLKPLQGKLDYGKTIPMGHVVAQHFGKQCYTLGFSAYQGRVGRPWTKSFPLAKAPDGSFDALCHAAGLQNAIVDLRNLPAGGDWLLKPFVTRPLGNQPMRGPWHEVLDGLFFQRDMTPSTRHGFAPPKESGAFLDELEKSWANVQSGLKRGNMWANKWTFGPALEQWLESAEPDVAQIEAQEEGVRRFLTEHRKEPEAVWRAHALLAAIAVARQSPQDALKPLEEALRTFPDREIPQPRKTSQFQHLVNRHAFITWDRTKKPPIKWAMDVVARDERLRYFYWQAWIERDAGIASKLKKALKKAYKQRKKKFPQQATEIERALREL